MAGEKAGEKKVGLLGGSFNPVHQGHVGICEIVFKERWVDEIWVVPCWQHPFDKPLVDFNHRLEMCRLAFESLGGIVRISDVERQLGGKSFTIRTVEHLKNQNPDIAFMLILGEDSAREAPKWNQYRELKEAVEWLVIPSGPHSKVPNIRATRVRQKIAAGEAIEEEVPKNVVEYIRRHGLYSTK